MIIQVWEVYKSNSQECVAFKTKELAKNQKIFNEVDFISPAEVYFSENEMAELDAGNPIYL